MTRLIKKYKNRRLYDTEKSQYITVGDLQRDVIDGVDFRVEDSVTKEDITSSILLQIFVEMEAGPSTFLSPTLLRQLITLAHHPMSQGLKKMLEEIFSTLEQQTKSHPFMKDYQQVADTWSKQMQKFAKQWEGFIRK